MRPLALAALAAALAACADVECTRNTDCGERTRCEMNRCVSDCRSDRDCKGGATCSLNGECVAPRPPVDVPEAGAPDAPADAAKDVADALAPMDAGMDATPDGAPDTGMDVGMDAPPDVAPDIAPDVMDTAPDAAPDVATDATPDADAALDRPAPDAPDAPDVAPDAPADAACTAVPWRATPVGGAGDWGGSTAIALDPAGAPHIVFHRAAYGSYRNRELLYATRSATGAWDFEQITQGTSNDRDDTTDLAFDPSGAPHVVFPGYATSGAATSAHATRSGTAWVITPLRGGCTWASLGVDAAGVAHVVSGQTEINYARRAADGAWTYEAQRPARCMNAVVSPEGTVHVSFATPPPSATGFNDLFYASRSPAGTWTYERVDSLGARYDYECGTAIGVTPGGAVHVLYTAAGGYRHASRAAGGAWRTQALTVSGGAWPAVAVDARGGVHATFGGALEHAYLPPGGAWRSVVVNLNPGSVPGYDASLAVDATGAVHVASYESTRPSPFRVYYTVGRPCAP